jgi:pimeloyl-ACP methyl ester carboxylesterase
MHRLLFVLSGGLLTTFMLVTPTMAAHTLGCADLRKVPIPNTLITLAQVNQESTNPLTPSHCEIVGSIDQRVGVDGKPYAIGFHLRMPIDWNGRFLFQGGGGTDGNLGDALGGEAINLGYAVVSTDAGHTIEPVLGIGGALFGLDPQARIDYGYRALDVVAQTARLIVKLRYGIAPRYSYFVGCSNGGRQGMVASQRFPELFDGIVAGDPGFNLPKAAVAEAWDSQAFAIAAAQSDVNGQPYLPTTFSDADLMLVVNAVLNNCDDLDGLVDGIIDNGPACRFDPVDLQCVEAKNETCLSLPQVAALRAVFGGARDSTGRALYSSFPWDAGIASPGWRAWKIGFPAPPEAPRINNAINMTLGASALPYIFVTPPVAVSSDGLAKYMMTFNFDLDAPKIFQTSRIYNESSIEFMSAHSTNLEEFQRRGKKLIVYHGASDPVFSVNDTIRWYSRLLKDTDGRADCFARLFIVPGMNHCGGGPCTDMFDALTAVADWVEHGKSPERILATAGPATPWPGRTRPLCPYPKQARYDGSGDINNAANFVCRDPDGR